MENEQYPKRHCSRFCSHCIFHRLNSSFAGRAVGLSLVLYTCPYLTGFASVPHRPSEHRGTHRKLLTQFHVLEQICQGSGMVFTQLMSHSGYLFTDASTRYMMLGLRNRISTSLIQNLALAQLLTFTFPTRPSSRGLDALYREGVYHS